MVSRPNGCIDSRQRKAGQQFCFHSTNNIYGLLNILFTVISKVFMAYGWSLLPMWLRGLRSFVALVLASAATSFKTALASNLAIIYSLFLFLCLPIDIL